MKVIQTIGNKSLWKREKTLFLTSKMAPFSTYEKVFKWVDSLDDADTVVCFNSSELEAEVVKALLVNRTRRGGCSQLRQICNLTHNTIRICNP